MGWSKEEGVGEMVKFHPTRKERDLDKRGPLVWLNIKQGRKKKGEQKKA